MAASSRQETKEQRQSVALGANSHGSQPPLKVLCCLRPDNTITDIDHGEELSVVVMRTARKTNYEEKLRCCRPSVRS